MDKKGYQAPKVEKVYTVDDVIALKNSTNESDILKMQYLLTKATEDDLFRVFVDWIDDDIKRYRDVADLYTIMLDIAKCQEDANSDNWHMLADGTVVQAFIDMFINSTEEKIGGRLNYDDFFEIPWIWDTLNIKQPTKTYRTNVSKEQKIKDIWFSNIITGIRNWLMHNRYIITGKGIYIHSKHAWEKKTGEKDEHGKDIKEFQTFEAMISHDFFHKIIVFCIDRDRKHKYKEFLIKNDINLRKWFKANKDNIKIEVLQRRGKWYLCESLSDIYSSMKRRDFRKYNERLSPKQEKFLSEYFEIHEFNDKSLRFLRNFMFDYDNRMSLNAVIDIHPSILDQRNWELNSQQKGSKMKLILESLTTWDSIDERKIWRSDTSLENEIEKIFKELKIKPSKQSIENKHDFVPKYRDSDREIPMDKLLTFSAKNEIIKIVKFFKYDLLNVVDINSSMVDYRKVYLKTLYLSKFYINNPKLELAQPQKRIWNKYWKQWCDYIMNRCKKNPKTYRSNEVKKAWIDKILWDFYRTYLFKQLTSWDVEDWIITRDNNEIEDYINNNRDYLMFNTLNAKKLSPEQKEIVENNVRKVITERKEKLDTVTLIWEEEHIRNAFAHHHYTIIPWFNKILLWDPSIDDTPNWEEIYDLDELYKNAVGRVNWDYLDIKVAA